MRHPVTVVLCLAAVALVGGCADRDADASRALQSMDLIDETNLNELMLTAAEPAEAVEHFRAALESRPDRLDLQRGLARSLVRAGRPTEGLARWREIAAHPEATHDDRVAKADALIRTGDWEGAAAVLDAIPPTFETFDRYRLEAMIADANERWDHADSFYETAVGLTTRPAGVLNNWGFSKLTRGDASGAERLFMEALSYDPGLFAAKNNLAMARGAQGNYTLPLIRLTETERAQLLHTMAVTAIRRGDVITARSLLQEAIDTHPQHFDVAVRALRALEAEGAT